MKKVVKVILIIWLIIIGLFIVGIVVYDNIVYDYKNQEPYYQIQILPTNNTSCYNISFDIIINDTE